MKWHCLQPITRFHTKGSNIIRPSGTKSCNSEFCIQRTVNIIFGVSFAKLSLVNTPLDSRLHTKHNFALDNLLKVFIAEKFYSTSSFTVPLGGTKYWNINLRTWYFKRPVSINFVIDCCKRMMITILLYFRVNSVIGLQETNYCVKKGVVLYNKWSVHLGNLRCNNMVLFENLEIA